MAKNTKALSGQAAKKYMRDLLKSDPGVSAEATDRLVNTCGDEIAQLRVRLPIPNRNKAQVTPAAPSVAPVATATAPKPTAPPPAPAVATTPAPAFDPFAFSVVVVLTKQGRDGLMAKLATVDSVTDLRAIAKAQHIAIPATGSADDLRRAIVDGTAARIADRQAASS
jgi:hypothetical protein